MTSLQHGSLTSNDGKGAFCSDDVLHTLYNLILNCSTTNLVHFYWASCVGGAISLFSGRTTGQPRPADRDEFTSGSPDKVIKVCTGLVEWGCGWIVFTGPKLLPLRKVIGRALRNIIAANEFYGRILASRSFLAKTRIITGIGRSASISNQCGPACRPT